MANFHFSYVNEILLSMWMFYSTWYLDSSLNVCVIGIASCLKRNMFFIFGNIF